MENTRTPERQRNWFLTGWLALIVLFNLFTVVSFLTGGYNSLQYQIPPQEGTPQWPEILVVIAAGAAILSCVAIELGYRFGWYGLVVSYVVLTAGSLALGFNLITVLVAVIVFIITWALIRPQWAQMK